MCLTLFMVALWGMTGFATHECEQIPNVPQGCADEGHESKPEPQPEPEPEPGDKDGDKVPDDEDQCPNDPGVPNNPNGVGCPETEDEAGVSETWVLDGHCFELLTEGLVLYAGESLRYPIEIVSNGGSGQVDFLAGAISLALSGIVAPTETAGGIQAQLAVNSTQFTPDSGPTDMPGGRLPGSQGTINVRLVDLSPLGGIILGLCIVDGCPGSEPFERAEDR